MVTNLSIIDITQLSLQEVILRLQVVAPDLEPPFAFAVEFEAHYPLSKTLRDTIAYIFDSHPHLEPSRSQFVTVVDELVNNSIEHGSREGDKNRIEIFLHRFDTSWIFEVRVIDAGHGPFPKTAAQMREIEAEKIALEYQKLSQRRGR